MSRFFIERPIFAWVLAIVVALMGVLSITQLPVSQYPEIAPPAVTITASYPGASAQTVEDSVTQVIEQQMNGIDNLRYMSASSDSSGTATLTLTFDQGADPDIAQVQVQNKLQNALPLLPQAVQQQGVQVAKSANSFLMVVGVVSDDPNTTSNDLGDFISSSLRDEISRVEGVGEVQTFGSPYAMRIWLDPNALLSYSLTPADVAAAVRAQNAEVSAGQIGGTPYVDGQQLNATVTSQSLLTTPEEFQQILVRTMPDGATVRLQDVARVELGAESYMMEGRFNGRPAAGMGIRLASGANAVATAEAVRHRLDELSANFPTGVRTVVPYDTTPFVEKSIEEVVKTLIEAFVLVFIVMFLFLQNWRATLITTVTVPVVLLGTFAVLSVLGFSINTLTMFAMVLAIGLLVDDAIVVVENVERVMREEHLSAKEATKKSMQQITGALIGIALVLSAVFIPMAFFPGSTGVIYRQFSVTVVSAMALSVLVALTLTPALTATLLKHTPPPPEGSRLGKFFNGFNRGFENVANRYAGIVTRTLAPKAGKRVLGLYAVILVALGLLTARLPSSFFPEEDQGFFITIVQLPSGATAERTRAVMEQIETYLLEDEGEAVDSAFSVIGFGFAGVGQNQGIVFVNMKDWSERGTGANSAQAVVQRAFGRFSQIRDAMVFPIIPPAVSELGIASGFDMHLTNLTGMEREQFLGMRDQLLGAAALDQRLQQVRPNGQEDTPQLQLDIDHHAASALGVSVADVNNTLSAAWGGQYINDFVDRGRVKRVYMQGDAPYRMVPEDLNSWYVRNGQGEMAPFSAFSSSRWISAPPRLERFNGAPSFNIQGQGAPGVSSGTAMDRMEALADELPPGTGLQWAGMSYEERLSGSQAPLLYALSLLVVFLCLAALYESWTIPLSVLVVVPLGLLGAVLAANLRGLSNDIYFQVGLLTTMGLAAKNAILIVEFARSLAQQGMDWADAALEAAKLRLRPILMTSFAFTCGVLPLAIATGAGSGAQNAIGTGVIGGMLAATLLVTVLTPFFFVLVSRMFARRPKPADATNATPQIGNA
ncbi:efflux RND transporter permease subunit [Vitreimonas flagellata]|uniref:efflux RND transporter permease subunit n=1 Tax=Vitreimonas flagellata TaxID=2560861 RepID=UPI001074D4FC|nr:efflux RND transporter permease subunit [Vitreimonas flagellata]